MNYNLILICVQHYRSWHTQIDYKTIRVLKGRLYDGLDQGSSNLSLEVQSAAEFSSNPDQTHLPVIF